MTSEELRTVLASISEKTGDDDEIMESLRSIQTAFDERDAVVNDPVYNESDVYDEDGVRWSEKYDNMKKRYRDRFFSSIDEAIEDQEEDIEKDDSSTVTSFEELFEEREGDYKEE